MSTGTSANANEFAGEVVERTRLDTGTIDKMFALFEEYFDNASREQFEADLAQKDWVCLGIDHATGAVGGFSTLKRRATELNGRPIIACYSGDTIVGREYRSRFSFLPGTVGNRIYEESRSHPGIPVYWLLLSSGYKTYRAFPVYFRSFYPRYDAQTPPEMDQLLCQLARLEYGDRFDEERGIVRFERPTPLRPAVLDLDERRLRDPHVRFFLERNPGHAAGDELVCITQVCDENLTAASLRYGVGKRAPVRGG